MKLFKNFLEKLFTSAVVLNGDNILRLLEKNRIARFLDLGCDDGSVTQKVAQAIGTGYVFGAEIVPSRIALARKKGIKVKKVDLNKKFTLKTNSFDVVLGNQVIEHLHNSDNFVLEIYRVLKPGGYAIISTENASSWCNILASLLGWQIFSLTNFSSLKQGIGNPFSLHREGKVNLNSWNHIRIYNYFGLREYFEAAGFEVEKILGAGYFPLPSGLGNLDKIHCHFMTFKIRKPV